MAAGSLGMGFYDCSGKLGTTWNHGCTRIKPVLGAVGVEVKVALWVALPQLGRSSSGCSDVNGIPLPFPTYREPQPGDDVSYYQKNAKSAPNRCGSSRRWNTARVCAVRTNLVLAVFGGHASRRFHRSLRSRGP